MRKFWRWIFNIMSKKSLQKKADELNAVIHRENLYMVATPVNRRVINAHIANPHGTKFLAVQDLTTGALYEVDKNRFFNGYGSEVFA
jgi:hypothetical protein